MPSFCASLRKLKVLRAPLFAGLFLMAAGILPPHAAGDVLANPQASGLSSHATEPGVQEPQSPEPQSPGPQAQEPTAPPSKYDPAIFQKSIPSEQLAFLGHFAGMTANDAVRDKQFRKLMHSVLPDCTFHYGWDMSPSDAFEKVLTGSPLPVQIRDGRYVTVSGRNGPYLRGRGFLWFDLQEGIALAGFYFHPTNGEPTPTVTVFSPQVEVKEESLKLSQLPPAFADALSLWSVESGVAPVTTRYFIGGFNKKILLEHDEDYCAPVNPATAPAADDCEQMNADAADVDLNAAYYLEQTNHATNATAWMLVGEDQVAWIQVRDNTCRIGPDRLGCRIRLTRERTHVVLSQHSVPHLPHK
jgi:uncharacterized protein YecT (DUF1311 family)